MPPIIFFNIGWMTHYEGPSDTDPIQGGGRYVQENQSGGEEWNFKPHRKKLYGYVQPTRGSSIRLERLGAHVSDETLPGVTVVWTARHPTSGGTFVVGWYQNSTIYRHYQELRSNRPTTWNWEGRETSYHVTAASTDTYLLAPDARTLPVPRGAGGMGQSNVWYAEDNPAFVAQVQAYIKSYVVDGGLPPKPPRPPRQADLLKRLAVERKAVELVWDYYAQLGYDVKSVEKDNVGWDLEASISHVHLKLEVKGLSGLALTVELTPNEYHHLQADRANYRLCVVTSALTKPQLHFFTYIREKDQWISQTGKILTLAELVSARAYCS